MKFCIFYCWLKNWPQNTEGKEGLEEEAGHPRSVSGRFNKQGNLHTELTWVGGRKRSSYLHPPARHLKIDIKAFPGFSHITYSVQMVSISQCSLKPAPLKMAQAVAMVGEC